MKLSLLPFLTLVTIGANAQNIIYIDLDATGNNNGTSWNDAYTDAQNAFDNSNVNDEFWIAEGKYIRTSSSRDASFFWNSDSVKVLGGFNGTETISSERNPTIHKTIFSGDLQNDNDLTNNAYTTFDGPKGSNLTPINYTLIDGIIIQDGYSNNPSQDNYKWGGGFYLQDYVSHIEFNNCTFRNNYAKGGAAIFLNNSKSNSQIKVNNCIFEDNAGDYGPAITTVARPGFTLNLEVNNSLMTHNKKQGILGTTIGGVFYFNSNGELTVNINNTTIADNNTGNYIYQTYAVNLLNEINFQNCIIYNNTDVTSFSAPYTNLTIPTNLTNCIFQVDSFDTETVVSDVNFMDPLFVNDTSDFRLSSNSPAINSGTNLPSIPSIDLAGNPRIQNSIVDLGCYENQGTISVQENIQNLHLVSYPNPTTGIMTFSFDEHINSIEIYTMTGQIVATYKNLTRIDLSHLVSGIYNAKVTSDNKTAVVRIVKN